MGEADGAGQRPADRQRPDLGRGGEGLESSSVFRVMRNGKAEDTKDFNPTWQLQAGANELEV